MTPPQWGGRKAGQELSPAEHDASSGPVGQFSAETQGLRACGVEGERPGPVVLKGGMGKRGYEGSEGSFLAIGLLLP